MISHLGPQLGVADQIAFEKTEKLPLFYREGATSEGDF
jgi:hypothetical protein